MNELFLSTTDEAPVAITNETSPSMQLEIIALPVKVGEKIKQIRVQKKLTQHQLAAICEFEKASMSRIESGQSNPTLRTLQRISTALEVPIVDLFS